MFEQCKEHDGFIFEIVGVDKLSFAGIVSPGARLNGQASDIDASSIKVDDFVQPASDALLDGTFEIKKCLKRVLGMCTRKELASGSRKSSIVPRSLMVGVLVLCVP